MRRRLLGSAVVLVGLVLVAACSHGSTSSSGDGATVVDTARSASAPAPAGAVAGRPSVAVAERAFVRTATIALRAREVDDTANRASAATTAAGGRVDGDIRTGDGGSTAHLVLRVPATRLDALLRVLDGLGTETSRTVSAEDVTATRADLGARTSATATSVARLQALLAKSATLADLLALESQLTQREADLESMQAQQRALADQVALATITVDVSARAPLVPRRAGGPTGFGHAVASGWHTVTLGARWAAAIVGYLLPPVALLAVVTLAGGVVIRRRRRLPSSAA